MRANSRELRILPAGWLTPLLPEPTVPTLEALRPWKQTPQGEPECGVTTMFVDVVGQKCSQNQELSGSSLRWGEGSGPWLPTSPNDAGGQEGPQSSFQLCR